MNETQAVEPVNVDAVVSKLDQILNYVTERDKLLDEIQLENSQLDKEKESVEMQKEADEKQAIAEKEEQQRKEDLENAKKIVDVLEEIDVGIASYEPTDYSLFFEEILSKNEQLVLNTTFTDSDQARQETQDSLLLYGVGAILFVVVICLPIYFIYRYIRAHFALLKNIF